MKACNQVIHRTETRCPAALVAMLGLFLLLGSPLHAQNGWIGLDLEFEDVRSGDLSQTEQLIVDDVYPDSPADGAGVEAGDILVTIDGVSPTRDGLADWSESLDPGDVVALVIDRSGDRLVLTFEAGEMPDDVRRRRILSFRRDQDGVERALVELELHLDSLSDALEVLTRERMDRIRLRLDTLRFDDVFRDYEQAERIFRDSTNVYFRNLNSGDGGELVWGLLPDGSDYTRGFSPFLWGGRAIAGAELAELNPSLGRYFGVEEGVLVIDVSERSPAGEGGLQPGDVLVEVGGEDVDSVAEVRELFARMSFLVRGARPDDGAETVRVTVVREGERLELELRE